MKLLLNNIRLLIRSYYLKFLRILYINDFEKNCISIMGKWGEKRMTYESRDSIKNIWGDRKPYIGEWPARQDIRAEEEPDHWVQSCCVLCSNGCGMDIGVKNGRIVGVRGREVDRINYVRLGPKGIHWRL